MKSPNNKYIPFGLSNYWLIGRRILLLLLLYAISRYAFYLFNKDLIDLIPWERMRFIFIGGFRFDLSAIFYVNALYVVCSLLPFRFIYKDKVQKWFKYFFIVTNAIALAINTMDFYYFRFTLRRTDSSVFKEFSGTENVFKIIMEAIVQQWELFLFWVVLVFVLFVCYGKSGKKLSLVRPWYFYLTRTAALLLTVFVLVIGMRGGLDRTTRPIAMTNAGAYIQEPIEAGVVLNTPFCLIRSSGNKALLRQAFYASEEALEAVYTPVHPAHADTLRPYNVVVFILESFAKPQIGAMNLHIPGHVGYTPFLDSIIANGHACFNAYANGRKSIDALPSVLGSIPSLTEPFILMPYALNELEGLGTLLGNKGYHTSFFHGAPNGSMGLDAISNMLGFRNYYGKTEYNNDADYDGVWGIWDEPFLQFFARSLNAFPQPFVSAVFTLSSHHPFKVPEQYKDKLPKGSEPLSQCIAYTDVALRRFFEAASKEPWFANTLFVFTADHSIWSEQYPVYQNSLGSTAIPIVYYAPGMVAPAKDTLPSQQIDILPTVLSYLHYDAPYFGYGRNLNDSLSTPFAFNYSGTYQLVRNGHLLQFDGSKVHGYYDLQQDPMLQQNQMQNASPEMNKELDFMKAFIQQYNNRLLDGKLVGK